MSHFFFFFFFFFFFCFFFFFFTFRRRIPLSLNRKTHFEKKQFPPNNGFTSLSSEKEEKHKEEEKEGEGKGEGKGEGGELVLYLDGERDGGGKVGGVMGVGGQMFPVVVGNDGGCRKAVSFSGLVNDVCIYNRPLPDQEIKELWEEDQPEERKEKKEKKDSTPFYLF